MSIRAIGRHSYVGEPHDCSAAVTIGNYTSVAPGVQMHPRIQHPCANDPLLVSTSTGNHIPGYPRAEADAGGITIGSDVWIGQGVVLLGSITIGHGAIIGAYSVVAKDVKPYAKVVGNPCRTLRYRFVPQTIARLLTIQWWDWPHEVVQERAQDFHNVNAFIAKYGYDVFEKEQ